MDGGHSAQHLYLWNVRSECQMLYISIVSIVSAIFGFHYDSELHSNVISRLFRFIFYVYKILIFDFFFIFFLHLSVSYLYFWFQVVSWKPKTFWVWSKSFEFVKFIWPCQKFENICDEKQPLLRRKELLLWKRWLLLDLI